MKTPGEHLYNSIISPGGPHLPQDPATWHTFGFGRCRDDDSLWALLHVYSFACQEMRLTDKMLNEKARDLRTFKCDVDMILCRNPWYEGIILFIWLRQNQFIFDPANSCSKSRKRTLDSCIRDIAYYTFTPITVVHKRITDAMTNSFGHPTTKAPSNKVQFTLPTVPEEVEEEEDTGPIQFTPADIKKDKEGNVSPVETKALPALSQADMAKVLRTIDMGFSSDPKPANFDELLKEANDLLGGDALPADYKAKIAHFSQKATATTEDISKESSAKKKKKRRNRKKKKKTSASTEGNVPVAEDVDNTTSADEVADSPNEKLTSTMK
ncbi:hypothetical protein CTRI78_v004121 [Colletotrichum trifolii]|uniref:Uncharacterized protein n=1 Tax=Colletotrichum trifolii TaxID=5466 RepID=A0A4R8RHX5_COLTR|nr:hypothetical protein CTRI78_v004121 [Colletotrichum trifolii]